MAAPTVAGAAAAVSGAAGVAVTLPTHQADDILVVVAECDGSQSYPNPAGDSGGAASGWALASSQRAGSGGGTYDTKLSIFWKRATSGSEPAPNFGDSGDHNVCAAVAIRGCPTTGNPWDVIATGFSDTVDTAQGAANVTTTVADCLILACIGVGSDLARTGNGFSWGVGGTPSGLSEQVDRIVTSGNGGGIGAYSGAYTGPGTTSLAGIVPADAAAKAYITIAFKPATAESHSGSSTVSGGAAVTTVGAKGASSAPTVSGGAAVTMTGRKGASSAPTVSGGGSALASGFKGALASVGVSGGAAATTSGTTARAVSAAVSAGARALASATTARSGTAPVSGGGTVTTAGGITGRIYRTLLALSDRALVALQLRDSAVSVSLADSAVEVDTLDE